MHEPTDLVELGTSDYATVDFSFLQPSFYVVVRRADLPRVCKASCLGYFHAVARQFGFLSGEFQFVNLEMIDKYS